MLKRCGVVLCAWMVLGSSAHSQDRVNLLHFSQKAIAELETIYPNLGGGEIYHREAAENVTESSAIDRNELLFASPELIALRGKRLILSIDTAGRKTIRMGTIDNGRVRDLSGRHFMVYVKRGTTRDDWNKLTRKLKSMGARLTIEDRSGRVFGVRFANPTLATKAFMQIARRSSHMTTLAPISRCNLVYETLIDTAIDNPLTAYGSYFPRAGVEPNQTLALDSLRTATADFRSKGLLPAQPKIHWQYREAPTATTDEQVTKIELLVALKETSDEAQVEALIKKLRASFGLDSISIAFLKEIRLLILSNIPRAERIAVVKMIQDVSIAQSIEFGSTVYAIDSTAELPTVKPLAPNEIPTASVLAPPLVLKAGTISTRAFIVEALRRFESDANDYLKVPQSARDDEEANVGAMIERGDTQIYFEDGADIDPKSAPAHDRATLHFLQKASFLLPNAYWVYSIRLNGEDKTSLALENQTGDIRLLDLGVVGILKREHVQLTQEQKTSFEAAVRQAVATPVTFEYRSDAYQSASTAPRVIVRVSNIGSLQPLTLAMTSSGLFMGYNWPEPASTTSVRGSTAESFTAGFTPLEKWVPKQNWLDENQTVDLESLRTFSRDLREKGLLSTLPSLPEPFGIGPIANPRYSSSERLPLDQKVVALARFDTSITALENLRMSAAQEFKLTLESIRHDPSALALVFEKVPEGDVQKLLQFLMDSGGVEWADTPLTSSERFLKAIRSTSKQLEAQGSYYVEGSYPEDVNPDTYPNNVRALLASVYKLSPDWIEFQPKNRLIAFHRLQDPKQIDEMLRILRVRPGVIEREVDHYRTASSHLALTELADTTSARDTPCGDSLK